MPEKNCCIITKCSARIVRKRVANWKGMIMDRERPRSSCGKKALNRQIFIVGYLQFVKREYLHAVV
jgi:hypothetical protein